MRRRRAGCAAGRRRPTGRAVAIDAVTSRATAAAVGLAGVQGRDGVEQVQLPGRRGGAQPRRSPRAAARRAWAGRPAVGTTAATTRAPHSSSGRPNTTASATSGCSRSAASTACGATFTPPVMTTSSRRPVHGQPAVVERGRRRGCGTSRRRRPPRSRGVQPVAEGERRPGELHAVVADPHPDAVQRHPVVHAAAGGLGHAVRRHGADAGRAGAVEQLGVGGGAADEDGVEGAQRLGLGVEEPAQLGGHHRGVPTVVRHAGQRGGERLARAPSTVGSAARPAPPGRPPAARRSPTSAGRAASCPVRPDARAWPSAEARTAAAGSSTARPPPVDPEVRTTRSAPSSRGSSGRRTARAASTTAGGPSGRTASGPARRSARPRPRPG